MMTTLVAAALGVAYGHAQVVNGDFSQPAVKGIQFLAQDKVTGWKTNDSKGQIEIWESGAKVGSGPVFNTPPGSKQFAEVNANSHGTLSQEVRGISAGNQYGFSFWHRGRHSATEEDSIEVTVKDGANVWKKTYSTTNAAWKQYTAIVGTKNGDGPVMLSFQAKSTASNDPTIGNFLTGIKLDASVKPPPCVANAAGDYQWTTDNTKTTQGNGKLENVGVVKLTADQKAVNLVGGRDGRKGTWQITNDCQVTIDWENGKYFDRLTLNADGKQMTGKNQIGTIITGKK